MLQIKAIPGNQAGGVFYSAMMPVTDIINENICKIERLKQEDFADASPQRKLDSTAVVHIAKDILKAHNGQTGQTGGLATPTAVLLSCDSELEYDEKNLVLTIPDGVELSIMDGQHRVNGWRVALEKNPDDENLKNSSIAVTIIPGISQINKIWQFYSCNYLAKKPTKDQSLNLIAHAHNINQSGVFIPTVAEKKAEKSESTFNVVKFVTEINKSNGSVWKNHILMEGDKSEKTENKTKMRAMVDVLQKYVFVEDSIYKIPVWHSYWRVLRDTIQAKYPDSALFKSTGCEVFNVVYNPFMNVVSMLHGRDLTETNIRSVWNDVLGKLDPRYAFLSNPDFWQTGSDVDGNKLENFSSRQNRGDLIKALRIAIRQYADSLQV